MFYGIDGTILNLGKKWILQFWGIVLTSSQLLDKKKNRIIFYNIQTMIITLTIFLEQYFQGKKCNLMFKILPFRVQSFYQNFLFFHGWNQQNIYSPWVTFSSMCTKFFGEKKLNDNFNQIAHGTMFWVQVFQRTHGWGCCICMFWAQIHQGTHGSYNFVGSWHFHMNFNWKN